MEAEEDMADNGGETREELNAQKAVLEADLKSLQKELAAYSDNDPTELERKKVESKKLFDEAEAVTDDIGIMESYIEKSWGKDALAPLQMGVYGDEFDTEEYVLKELVYSV